MFPFFFNRGRSLKNNETPEKSCNTFLITITLFLTSVHISNHNYIIPYLYAGNFSTILLLILCTFKWYTECLDRHIFLEDTCTNIKVTKKNLHPRFEACMDNIKTKSGVDLSCDYEFLQRRGVDKL